MPKQQELNNNAFKELILHEEMLAQKYADFSKEIMNPQIQNKFKGMEMSSRTRYSMLTEKMKQL